MKKLSVLYNFKQNKLFHASAFLMTACLLISLTIFINNKGGSLQNSPREGDVIVKLSSGAKESAGSSQPSAGFNSNINSRNIGNHFGLQSSHHQMMKDPRLAGMLEDATLVESRQEEDQNTGHIKKSLLFETNFKYPLIKVEQTIEPGTKTILAETSSVADHIILQVDPSLTEDQVRSMAIEGGYQVRRKMFTAHSYLVEDINASLDSVDHLLKAFNPSRQEGVVVAEADYLLQTASTIPNDPDFSKYQWSFKNTGQHGGLKDADIDAPEAWDITTGSKDVVVAIVDTGVDWDHLDLRDNMWINPDEKPRNDKDDDGNNLDDDIYGWDFVSNDADPTDFNGHGTHCAGIVGAVGDNNEGVAGVCWDVSIMSVRVFDVDSKAAVSDVVDGINYAVDKKADVILNAYGQYQNISTALANAILNVRDNDIIFVTAAGNGNVEISDNNPEAYYYYPASFNIDNIVAVAATDRNDQLAPFSNYGIDSVDIAAPGERIFSTENYSKSVSSYATRSGTSMAAAHVAGVCALIRSVDPSLSYGQVLYQLYTTADRLYSLNDSVIGGRRLNAYDAVRSIPPYNIEGVVTNGDSPFGVAGAQVQYFGPVSGTVFTQANGTYIIHVPKGTYTLQVSADGFLDSGTRDCTVPPGCGNLNFSLYSADYQDLKITPGNINANLDLGELVTKTITLEDVGNVEETGLGHINWYASIDSYQDLNVPGLAYPVADLTGKTILTALYSPLSNSTVLSDLAKRGATVVNLDHFPSASNLRGVSALVVDEKLNYASASDITTIRDWVFSGGSLYAPVRTDITSQKKIDRVDDLLKGTGLYVRPLWGGQGANNFILDDITPHRTTEGISPIKASFDSVFHVIEPAQTLMDYWNFGSYAAFTYYGAGKILAVSDNLFHDSYQTDKKGARRFNNQAFDWLMDWIDLSDFSGTISQDDTQKISLTLGDLAGDLSFTPGVYDADIIFSWDTADTTVETTVPVKLSVSDSGSSGGEQTTVTFNAASTLNLNKGYKTINIEADATSKKHKIDHVKLYLDGKLIRKDSKPKYKWDHGDNDLCRLKPGSYELKVVAQDKKGRKAEAFETLTVGGSGGGKSNKPPKVSFKSSSTLNLKKGYKKTSLLIEAQASDADGSVAQVELYLNNKLVGRQGGSPYLWKGVNNGKLQGLSKGSHKLKLVATDNQGAKSEEVALLKVK